MAQAVKNHKIRRFFTAQARRRALLYSQYVILMGGCLAISAFILMNGYELAFSRPLPYAGSLETVPVRTFLDLNTQPSLTTASLGEGSFGRPTYLKVRDEPNRLQLAPSLFNDGSYLARAAAGHFAYLGPSKNGNIGTTAIYLRQSWRTIADPDALKPGANLFVDTDRDWRYMFRVTQTTTLPFDAPYVVPQGDTGKLILVIIDDKAKAMHLVVADFVTIQNIQL